MACVLTHNWGWPRRRGDQDLQTCIDCGAERLAPIQFGEAGPGLRVGASGFQFAIRVLIHRRRAASAQPRAAKQCDQERALAEAVDRVGAECAEAAARVFDVIDRSPLLPQTPAVPHSRCITDAP
jgi:hypothetical protein